MIASILDRLDALEYLAATLKTRLGNVVRTGVVQSFDAEAGAAVVNLGDDESSFVTHKVPTNAHAGTAKDWRPYKTGQQVTLLCADGDLSNAVVIPGGFHDQNPSPSTSASEDIVCARGQGRVRATDDAISLELGGLSVTLSAGKVTVTAPMIELNGDVTATGSTGVTMHAPQVVIDSPAIKLGGDGADKPLAMQGTVDSGGFIDVGNLSTTTFTR